MNTEPVDFSADPAPMQLPQKGYYSVDPDVFYEDADETVRTFRGEDLGVLLSFGYKSVLSGATFEGQDKTGKKWVVYVPSREYSACIWYEASDPMIPRFGDRIGIRSYDEVVNSH